jgi:hypothetical protein
LADHAFSLEIRADPVFPYGHAPPG